MASPCFGLVVEGTFDEAVFRHLIPRLVPNPYLVLRPAGGYSKLRDRFPGYLQGFEHDNQGDPVGKALVICDSDMTEPTGVEEELAARINQRKYAFPVQLCAVKREIEAWLLADHEAINRVAQRRAGMGAKARASTVQQGPESILDPKDHLRRMLSECGLPYDAAVCGEIAAEMDLDRLRYRCPTFGRFEQKLHDC